MALQEQLQQVQQMQQMQQQIDNVQQTIHQTEQHTQYAQQQTRQQVDEVLQRIQQMDQQAEQSQQRIQQNVEETLLKSQQTDQQKQQIDEVLRKIQMMDQAQLSHQQLQQTIQETPQHLDQQIQHSQKQLSQRMEEVLEKTQTGQKIHRALGRFAIVQYQIRSILRPDRGTSIPMLFVVLPKTISLVGEQGKSYSSQFRLYYLCENNPRRLGTYYGRTLEVHLAEHGGYDLVNPNGFFDKWDYGAKADGFLVPPLLNLHVAREVNTGQKHLDFVERDINRLVNDTIAYLEEVTGTTDSDSDVSAYQKLATSDLEQLISYLVVKDGESVTGDLDMTPTRNNHYQWVCKDHCYV
ncbi:hypothetical protein BGZ65_009521 [Modicella reniformis]|uniref:Uncharacterized protein n=1 Tax=Modicella reniformis TaxID=1440133 RepID=A0A9P6J4A0_9FUNG|nr:hypothetical protein BGZ65_009521 [Modicella reniformis]